MIKTARVFANGRSQAVRLPKEFRISGRDVYIKKFQGMVLLIPKDAPWASLISSLDHFSEDFMDTRDQPADRGRDAL